LLIHGVFPVRLRSGKKFAGGEAGGGKRTPRLPVVAPQAAVNLKYWVAGSSGIVDGDAGLVIPWHPIAGVLEDLGGMLLESNQVAEGIDAPYVAGVDQAHEHITDNRAVFGLVEQTIFSMENSLFQSLLTNVMPTSGLCRVEGLEGHISRFWIFTDAA
jgi:hypothetical protein